MSKKSDRTRRPHGAVLAFLIATAVIPLAAGVYRGTVLMLEGDWSFDFESTTVDPLPLFLHVVGSALFYVLAVAQLWPPLRTRFPKWHRRAGRVAFVGGLIGALSALWITLVHSEVRGDILYYGRLVFGPAWALFLVLAILAIRRRDIASHRAWMIRAFAVAMPAGTLAFIFAPIFLIFGDVSETVDDIVQSAAWIVHLAIAEIILCRFSLRRSAPAPVGGAGVLASN